MAKEPKSEKKTAKKEKKEKQQVDEEAPAGERKGAVSKIAVPLADDKLSKKVRRAGAVGFCPPRCYKARPQGCAPPISTAATRQHHQGTPVQVLKLAKKAAKRKQIKRGVKEVIKAIRKNVKG